jgi:dienelactone hydrolase
MYFGIATNDDMQQPDAKVKLKEAFDAVKNPADIEVYSMAQHGWCVPHMPAGANGPIYKKDDARTRVGQADGAIQIGARLV